MASLIALTFGFWGLYLTVKIVRMRQFLRAADDVIEGILIIVNNNHKPHHSYFNDTCEICMVLKVGQKDGYIQHIKINGGYHGTSGTV